MDYETERRTFNIDVPERFNFARDVFDAHAAATPDALALLLVGGGPGGSSSTELRRTYAELAAESRLAARALAAQGVGRGDVVLLNVPRVYEWWLASLALLRLGAVMSPGTTTLSSADLRHRATAARAVAIIGTAPVLERFADVADECPTVRAVLRVGGGGGGGGGGSSFEEALALAGAGEAGGGAEGEEEAAAAAAEQRVVGDCADTAAAERALLFFTSGTTGAPKMASHSHASYGLGHQITARYWLGLRPGDLHWNLSDTGWAKAAWSSFYAPWTAGATVFADGDNGAFDPRRALSLLTAHPITSFCAAPTAYRMLVQQDLGAWRLPAAAPSLRLCCSAGEPLNPEVIGAWAEATGGLVVRDGYGQTETCLLVGSFPCIEPRPGSMGKPAPGYDVQVVDGDSAARRCDDEEEGDIAVRVSGGGGGGGGAAAAAAAAAATVGRPVGLFDGYVGDEARTAGCFRRDASGDEWYLTGDRAYRDTDGYLWFVGRSDDVIITAGYRVGPFEVESALIEHAAVVESAVVASPDELRGAVVKAFVVLAPERAAALAAAGAAAGEEAAAALVAELQEHVKRVTAPYKYPRKIEFVESLPKTVSGKIRRIELRAREG
jgi:acetyl-CoA synthetase/medium-chain acyl-CoA synthetase